jgi:glyoxylase-like metal-dependent hydrolase (beta-lactamase superfamily II)
VQDRAHVSVGPIDLHYQDAERVIGCYLLETPDGPALFDCGPTSCLERLRAGVRERGLELGGVRHLLLSHIHLDHAGAAGVLVRENPSLQVHVSEVGAPHLVDPSRLERSARRLYGDAFDSLWGELAPVPDENVHIVGERVLGLECFPAPGHASHHVCYLDADGTLYAGDAAGVRIPPDSAVLPPTPPPEFDHPAWIATADEILRRDPRRLALIHFGVFVDVRRHVEELLSRLEDWTTWTERGLTEEEFSRRVRESLAADDTRPNVDAYERAMPFWQSYAGLKRYWDTRGEAA